MDRLKFFVEDVKDKQLTKLAEDYWQGMRLSSKEKQAFYKEDMNEFINKHLYPFSTKTNIDMLKNYLRKEIIKMG